MVDLEVRIANTEVSAQRLRELLAEADGVPNLLAIETELTNRETQIEQMKGQLQVLRDQVDLSTVTVRFTEERETDPEVADAAAAAAQLADQGYEVVDDEPQPGPRGSRVAYVNPHEVDGTIIQLVEI